MKLQENPSRLINSAFYITFSILFLLVSACQQAEEQDRSPNVILIMTDDQGYGDLAIHGNPYIKTPNLDQFAQEAVECTNFHVGTTCSPTRAGLMTGRNANRIGAWHTIAGCSILNAREETIAEVFKRNGYGTAMFGKWHLGDSYPFRPHDRGFDKTFYHGGGGVIQTPDYWLNDYFDDTYFRNGEPEKTAGYCTDVWFDEAINYIDSNRDKPFFMYLATNAAHGPFNVPQEYMDMYQEAPIQPIQRRFYGMITNLDENFGRLDQRLKELGMAENTIVIFMTDNGTAAGIRTDKETGETYGYNAGLRGIKGSHYDGGHLVPFFIRWPNGGLEGGKQTKELLAHVDILPTLAKFCGLNFMPKAELDGMDMSEVMRGEKSKARMLVTDTQRNQWPEKGRNSCVMDGVWRLVNGTELYNIETDPGQEKDLAEDFPDRVGEMKKFYDAWWRKVEREATYSVFPIGNENANPTSFTIHDMHTSKGLPWNQRMIRKGDVNNDGFYSVSIEKDGIYEFMLSRWPFESGLQLNAAPEAVPNTASFDGYSKGESLDIRKAVVSIGDYMEEIAVDPNETHATVQISLAAGTDSLKTYFLDAEGEMIPVYYHTVKYLNNE